MRNSTLKTGVSGTECPHPYSSALVITFKKLREEMTMNSPSKTIGRVNRSSAKWVLICLVLGLCALNFSGCFVYNKLKAKDKLNSGARLFNAGRYDQAAVIFKEAMELNPDLLQAKLFYATALRSQVAGADPDSQKKAREAIKVYEDLVNGSLASKVSAKDKDQAYAFIADLYSKLDDTESQKKWLEGRAKLAGQKSDVVAQCYYAICVIYWEASHKTTDKYVVPNVLPPKYRPVNEWDQKDVGEATKNIQQGMKYNAEALKADPNYANAYSYLNLLYREQIKMESDPKKVTDLAKLADEAVEKFQELNRKAADQQGG